jgi:hypothetical protein
MTSRAPSYEEWMRMPICAAVVEQIRSCDSSRALFNELADEIYRLAYEFDHRNCYVNNHCARFAPATLDSFSNCGIRRA